MTRIPTDRSYLVDSRADEVMTRKRIIAKRKELGRTTADVAHEIGMSRPVYTQLKGGSRRLTVVYFLAMCRALKVEPGELLE